MSAAYVLEYGVDKIEMHVDAVQPGQKVVLIDDLVATGGTAAAGAMLHGAPRPREPQLQCQTVLADLHATSGANIGCHG